MGESKGDASGPSDGGSQDWLEGRQGLSRESLDRAEAEIDRTGSDVEAVAPLRAATGDVVERVRLVVSSAADRIRAALGETSGTTTGEAGGDTFSAEADGGPGLADRTGPDEREAGTAPATDGAGSRQEDRAGVGKTGDESAFNWGGTDGDAEPAE